LEDERNEWRREAKLQHDICVDAFSDLRAATATIGRLTDTVTSLRSTVARQREVIGDLTVRLQQSAA
jgi:hypothetical protein